MHARTNTYICVCIYEGEKKGVPRILTKYMLSSLRGNDQIYSKECFIHTFPKSNILNPPKFISFVVKKKKIPGLLCLISK